MQAVAYPWTNAFPVLAKNLAVDSVIYALWMHFICPGGWRRRRTLWLGRHGIRIWMGKIRETNCGDERCSHIGSGGL